MMAQNRRRQLRELYARVPSANCKGICVDSCGPIAASQLEERTLREHGVVLEDRVEAVRVLADGGDFTCPALVDGQCSVYDDRPLICRLWGVTETLRCPYGCEPDAVLSDPEAYEMIAESMRIGGEPAGFEPLPDPAVIRRAAERWGPQLAPLHDAMRPTDPGQPRNGATSP